MAKQTSPYQGASKPNSIQARAVAARVVFDVVEKGRSLTDALNFQFRRLPSAEDRALIQELSYGVMRYLPRLKAVADQLLDRPLKRKDQDMYALVLVGLYQQIYLNIPPHAVVAETVEAARQLGKKWAVGLINAVLRNFQRQHETLLKSVDKTPSHHYSWPDWLLLRVQNAWPEDWREIVSAANSRPPMTLRVNALQFTRDDYLALLKQSEIPAKAAEHVSAGIILDKPCSVDKLPGFTGGSVSVQDSGAQLAAELLGVQPGQRVLDACAAPGGKACHLLECSSEIELTALDVDEDRLQRVQENLDRLGLKASVVAGDATDPQGDWAEQTYQRILLDAPCTATGVIRRHPDIKTLRRAEDVVALVGIQAKMLDAIWPLLAPAGILLYITCSLLPEENEQQIKAFLQRHTDARLVPITADWGVERQAGRQTLPGASNMDGFYYARLEKITA